MKLPNWDAQFKPITDQRGWGVRSGQAKLGNAFIHALNTKTSVMGEAGTGTGKSMIGLIPVIHAINASKAEGRAFRAIISTETITLQDQVTNKDLPDLARTYPGFTFKKLMGRSNYLCLDAASEKVVGNSALNNIYMRLEGATSRLTTGDKSDCEMVLGRTLSRDEWESITGSADFCSDNKCEDTARCYGAKARAEALTADIVVCNHALLATDVESKSVGTALEPSEGILGPYQAIIVDEGHRLVPVFTAQNSISINGYEIFMMGSHIETGAQHGKQLDGTIDAEAIEFAISDLQKILDTAIQYYSFGADDWDRSEFPLTFRFFAGVTPQFMDVMNSFENTSVNRLTNIIDVLERHDKKVQHALKNPPPPGVKLGKVRKGLRQTKKLIEIVKIIRDSLLTDDGIVNNYGMYGVVINGYTSKKDNTKRANIILEPLNVAPKIKALWNEAQTSLLMSATLSDPTHKDPFKFIKLSTGFPEDAPVIKVESPFDVKTQQLVYITKADKPTVEGGRYSFEEMYDMVMASQGRSLILFTSRSDLETAATKLRIRQGEGRFPYRILVQEKDSDKKMLAEEFKRDTSSVLLGTDSFMTGFDAPGETLTQVILCKFTMPRYNAQMKQKITYWRNRGFPNYYQHMALEKFEQAAGRGVRSEECRAVFSLLDQAAMDTNSHVFKTAKMGIDLLGSPITQDQNTVEGFIYGTR